MNKTLSADGIRLHGAPLSEAPQNELGVVYLFARLQERFGVRIDKIRAGFPDCLARKIRSSTNKIIRIEFEYKSANFKTHGHNPNGCDWIVCWEHNWHDVPKRLRVIELRREFGLGWTVWLNPKSIQWYEGWDKSKAQIEDTIPKQAHVGDLVLIYFRKPRSEIAFVSVIKELKRDDRKRKSGHSGKPDWWATTKKLCKLESPISFSRIKADKELKSAGFVRGYCQARQNITEFWPELYRLIILRNPQAKMVLQKYAPEKMDGQILALSEA
jgi:hypothetical protein